MNNSKNKLKKKKKKTGFLSQCQIQPKLYKRYVYYFNL